MPRPLPSSVMFGGPDLASLFVTSISDSGNRRNNHPQSGLIFEVKGGEYEGIKETPFRLSSWLYSADG